MCGGVSFKFSEVDEAELSQFFSPAEIAKFRATGEAQSFFWSLRPVLPVRDKGKVKLYNWGNRDKALPLPQTGWAKIESLVAGRWRHLHPQEVEIPATRGYEKKVWFEIEGGIRGVLVEKGDLKRVYLVTQEATPEFQALTKHNRMPIMKDR